jgi:hypothetical protein
MITDLDEREPQTRHELELVAAEVLRHRLTHPAALPYVAQQVVGAILGALEPVLARDPIRDLGTAIEADPRRLLVDHLEARRGRP